ncbi:restriction endonuclease subunit S [Bacteroides uniformis]|uniref:Restriction endonuclease subunit S n=1 Tax=Bacteroides xylanisolvens TaxID=371601 RepID=A0A7J5PHI9_9BACE|nr:MULTISPECIES: restriction endonuclease subunit S [Bacteroides]KAB4165589.1 restriction endonuclease subunit S [Bacteroides uniformis]KAB6107111.1 restriction endonuclease subunit S [Bacteroides xylanisolvens]KAB6114557.1 restriction endonuclease subunit S [Bacteroides xylanisolvens]KAB6126862.1 restriction endonuclease subunit S [Bacteroides xylanisolvens]KAB6138027.1 restriction endonuclease subunit S [Bacteroides xylanisolvens]
MGNVPNLRFPEFCGEWETIKVSELLDFYSTNSLSWEQLDYSNGKIKNLHYGLIHKGVPTMVDVACDSLPYIKEESMLKSFTLFKEGDVAFADASEDTNDVAKAIEVVNCDNQQIVSGLHTIHGRDNSNRTVIGYKGYAFASDSFHKQIRRIAQGTKVFSISVRNFDEAYIGIPSKEEQTQIAKLLITIDKRIATQNKIIEKLQSLIKGLIDDIITLKCGQLVAFETLYSKAGEGGTPTTSNTEFYDNGSIPFIKIDDLSNKYLSANKDYITELGLKKSSAWLIPTHSIIYSNGATIGAISINKYPVCTKQGILGIVPNTNIDVEFLYYFMQSSYFQKEVERVVTEGTMKTAYLKDINHIKCPIPDLDRQKEISHLLSVLSLKEDVERQLLQKYQIQKQYLLRKMFI